jgi:hypothetical protein
VEAGTRDDVAVSPRSLFGAALPVEVGDVVHGSVRLTVGPSAPGTNTISYTCANSGGTVSFSPTGDITWTATGGTLGAPTTGLQYFSIYDDTPTTPIADPLMCKFDYGAPFVVATGETMTLDFDTTLFQLV